MANRPLFAWNLVGTSISASACVTACTTGSRTKSATRAETGAETGPQGQRPGSIDSILRLDGHILRVQNALPIASIRAPRASLKAMAAMNSPYTLPFRMYNAVVRANGEIQPKETDSG
jgi:hypothetical protein